MAIGTPVDRGTAKRFISTGDLLSSSFTSVAGELLFAFVSISGNSTVVPDSISGHAPASGDGSWIQVGTTQHTAGSSQDSVSLWIGRSVGATESIAVTYATASLMTASFVSVTGCSGSGNALNALVQYDENWDYVKTLDLSLPNVANTSLHFWERGQAGAFASVDGITINEIGGNYNSCQIETSYVSGGDAVPSASYSIDQSTYLVGFAVELKPEGNVTFINVDGDDIIKDGQTTVAINLGEGGNSVTAIKLEFGGLSVAQSNVSITNDTLVTFDVVTGSLPWGVINLVVTAGGQDFPHLITLIPINGNEYVVIADPLKDNPAFLSLLDNAPGPTPIDGDVIEYVDGTNKITVNPSGSYEIAPGGPTSFIARRWSYTTEVWGEWASFTVDGQGSPNQSPVVTAPSGITIEYTFGAGGLAKNDSTLVAWLASATVADDNDAGLTVSADLSGLADPIPAGTHVITFLATDSGGFTGSDTALLTVAEAAEANQAPVVTPPADLSIEYAFGAGGLAQNNSTLVAWLASATVADDNDTGLTASGDLSGLSDPIPAGTHLITFTSTADSGSLVGTATANLIVSEAAQPNQAPVVTPPSNITIQHANNAVGLAKNAPALLAWIATASATDDNDVDLTVSADLSGLADPIPVGIYEITFTSSADSGGLVGTASAFLTVQEAAALSPDVVYAPGFRVVALGGNKHRAKIYNGKSNRIRFELLNNGVSYADLALTTRAVFTLYHSGSVLTLDSDLIAAAFDWTVGNGYIDINPSALSVVDGTLYEAELVIYNSSHTAGVVFIDRDLLTIEGA